jgi:hypothetical protein
MSDSDSAPPAGEGERGILASLPHTRPQRPSARRAAARSKRTRAPVQAEPARAPKQGFESESELPPGRSVAPPSSAELAASIVELLGELAQSGLTSGGRLLREALGRLPGA